MLFDLRHPTLLVLGRPLEDEGSLGGGPVHVTQDLDGLMLLQSSSLSWMVVMFSFMSWSTLFCFSNPTVFPFEATEPLSSVGGPLQVA